METTRRSNTSLVISLVLFLCVTLLLVTAIIMVFGAIFPYIVGGSIDANGMIISVAFGIEAIILGFATYFCFQKFLGWSASEAQTQIRMPVRLIVLVIITAGIPMIIGYLIRELEDVKWIALPRGDVTPWPISTSSPAKVAIRPSTSGRAAT